MSDLIAQLGSNQPVRRGLSVDEQLRVKGTSNIWAIGDCSVTPRNYPATAQVASQEGRYLGRLFNDVAESLYEAKKVRRSRAEKRQAYLSKFEQSGAATDVISNSKAFDYSHFGSFAYIGNWEAGTLTHSRKPDEYTVLLFQQLRSLRETPTLKLRWREWRPFSSGGRFTCPNCYLSAIVCSSDLIGSRYSLDHEQLFSSEADAVL